MGLWFLIVDTTEAFAVLRGDAATRDTLAVLGTSRSSTAALQDLPRMDPTGTLVAMPDKLWRGVTVRRAAGGLRHGPTDAARIGGPANRVVICGGFPQGSRLGRSQT